MISIKHHWSWFRKKRHSESRIVRSNSFTLQLTPRFNPRVQAASSLKLDRSMKRKTIAEDLGISNQKLQHEVQLVRYIFSAPMSMRPTTVQMLQNPLRKVYLAYIRKQHSSVPAILEVTTSGLQCQHVTCDGSDVVNTFNPFHTIAFWAAAQCVITYGISENGRHHLHLGFFPFAENGQWLVEPDCGSILDDETFGNVEMGSKEDFTEVNGPQLDGLREDEPQLDSFKEDAHGPTSFVGSHESMGTLRMSRTSYQPFFACVMRRSGAPHLLYCHVFLCSDSQQAIKLAATLYETLSFHISHKHLRDDMQAIASDGEQRHFPKSCNVIQPSRRPMKSYANHFKQCASSSSSSSVCHLCQYKYSGKCRSTSSYRRKKFSQHLIGIPHLMHANRLQRSDNHPCSSVTGAQCLCPISEHGVDNGNMKVQVSDSDPLTKECNESSSNAVENMDLLSRIAGSAQLRDVFRPDESDCDGFPSGQSDECKQASNQVTGEITSNGNLTHKINVPIHTPLWLKFLLQLGLRQPAVQMSTSEGQLPSHPLYHQSLKCCSYNNCPLQSNAMMPFGRKLSNFVYDEQMTSCASVCSSSLLKNVVSTKPVSCHYKCSSDSQSCNSTTSSKRHFCGSDDEAYAEIMETMVGCEQRQQRKTCSEHDTLDMCVPTVIFKVSDSSSNSSCSNGHFSNTSSTVATNYGTKMSKTFAFAVDKARQTTRSLTKLIATGKKTAGFRKMLANHKGAKIPRDYKRQSFSKCMVEETNQLKKDAEIISVLGQIAQKKTLNSACVQPCSEMTSSSCDHEIVKNEKIEMQPAECDWGCSTFLP